MIVSDQDVLEEVIKFMTPRARRKFLELVKWLQDQQTEKETTRRVSAREAIFDLADLEAAAASMSDTLNAAYVRAADRLAKKLAGEIDRFVHFDRVSEHAVSQLRARADRWGKDLPEEQRQLANRLMFDGLNAGENPRTIARRMRLSMGLTETQAEAVANYERLLRQRSSDVFTRELRDKRFDATIRRAFKEDRPLNNQEITRMVDRYRERSLAKRAETIARNEVIGASHQGAEELWRQSLENSTLRPNELEGEWLTAGDTRVRNSHDGMNHQKRPFGQPFLSDRGNLLRFPHDPQAPLKETIQCRCVKVTRFKRAA